MILIITDLKYRKDIVSMEEKINIELRLGKYKVINTEDLKYLSYVFTSYEEANEFIKKLQWMKQHEIVKIHGFWYSDTTGFNSYYYISEDGEIWKMDNVRLRV